MELIIQGIIKAFELIISFDPEVMGITWLSLKISGTATLISLFIGVSIGTIVALTNFRRKETGHQFNQHGHGLAAGCCGSVCHDFDLAQRASGISGNSLYPLCHDYCPGDHRHADCHGHIAGCHSKPAAQFAACRFFRWAQAGCRWSGY